MSVHPKNLAQDKAATPKQGVSGRTVGILALQGDYIEHANILRRLGVTVREVRSAGQLEDLDALIIPGGESTTIGKLAAQFNLIEPLRRFIRQGKPTWGTCAGLIFLARHIGDTPSGGHIVPQRLEVMDITVNRNAFGRQKDSFEADLNIPALDDSERAGDRSSSLPFRAVFIRAPNIESVADEVRVIARLEDPPAIVAVRQGNLLGTAFHPELTDDDRFHRYFLAMVSEA